MLNLEGNVSLHNFLVSFATLFSICVVNLYLNLTWSLPAHALFLALFSAGLFTLLKFTYNDYCFKIAIRAAFLGTVFALGLYVKLVAPSNYSVFGGYMCVMAVFHYSEFLAIAVVQPKQVTTDSFVINHSPQYTIAAVTSWLEFFLEAYFIPGMKEFYWISNVGLTLCIMGEILRKTAILTAGSNFNHLVQCEKSNDHMLVTHGVYAWFRHPSYVGWFYWSVGTQIVLLNPICVPAYAVASWLFFKGRIYIEEIMLLNFFGQHYCDYQQKVGTGIPFIEGYRV